VSAKGCLGCSAGPDGVWGLLAVLALRRRRIG
jgi:MYXO-CTERM domain-containing protein